MCISGLGSVHKRAALGLKHSSGCIYLRASDNIGLWRGDFPAPISPPALREARSKAKGRNPKAPARFPSWLVVLDREDLADDASVRQVLGLQASPPLEGQGGIPARPVAPEALEAKPSELVESS
jgi:hypothetical protein